MLEEEPAAAAARLFLPLPLVKLLLFILKTRHRKRTRQDTGQETGKEQNMVQEEEKT